MYPALVTFAVTWIVSTLALVPLLAVLRRLQVVDVPNHRSLHREPTPRGGGIALTLGLAAGLLASGGAPWPFWVGTVGFALLGAVDDISPRSAAMRLGVQLLLAGTVSLGLAQAQSAGIGLAVFGGLVLVATVNATNFMDGINGITSMNAIAWGVAYGILFLSENPSTAALAAVALLGAGAAFLPWNAPQARLFLGDSGSYLIGGTAGTLAILAVMAGHPVAALCPLATYAADTSWAVFRRLRDREPLATAHKVHVFQRLVDAGWSHTRCAIVVTAFTSVSAALGLAALDRPWPFQAAAVVGVLSVNLLYLRLPRAVAARGGNREEVM